VVGSMPVWVRRRGGRIASLSVSIAAAAQARVRFDASESRHDPIWRVPRGKFSLRRVEDKPRQPAGVVASWCPSGACRWSGALSQPRTWQSTRWFSIRAAGRMAVLAGLALTMLLSAAGFGGGICSAAEPQRLAAVVLIGFFLGAIVMTLTSWCCSVHARGEQFVRYSRGRGGRCGRERSPCSLAFLPV